GGTLHLVIASGTAGEHARTVEAKCWRLATVIQIFGPEGFNRFLALRRERREIARLQALEAHGYSRKREFPFVSVPPVPIDRSGVCHEVSACLVSGHLMSVS